MSNRLITRLVAGDLGLPVFLEGLGSTETARATMPETPIDKDRQLGLSERKIRTATSYRRDQPRTRSLNPKDSWISHLFLQVVLVRPTLAERDDGTIGSRDCFEIAISSFASSLSPGYFRARKLAALRWSLCSTYPQLGRETEIRTQL
jgi:hypothetical protein